MLRPMCKGTVSLPHHITGGAVVVFKYIWEKCHHQDFTISDWFSGKVFIIRNYPREID